ncbi:MAG: GDSL-type esterase/lipase family protein [Prochlorothrix sp.]
MRSNPNFNNRSSNDRDRNLDLTAAPASSTAPHSPQNSPSSRKVPAFLQQPSSLQPPAAPSPLPPDPAPSVTASAPRFSLPLWFLVSLVVNGFLLTWVVLLSSWPRPPAPGTLAGQNNGAASLLGQASTNPIAQNPRHQLSYERWVALLAQEADVAATQKPAHLSVLAGDSISLWFPEELIPQGVNWLNQGISGETAGGLRQRLYLFDQVDAEVIFVMIGINDLIKGTAPETVAQEQQTIVRNLKSQHPRSKIVVQSILPHSGPGATWEGRDRLLALPNSKIYALNQTLEAMAQEEGVYFLDLWPLFSDNQGNLRLTLSSDGLHLNDQGYLVWATALQLFRHLQLGEVQSKTLPKS